MLHMSQCKVKETLKAPRGEDAYESRAKESGRNERGKIKK